MLEEREVGAQQWIFKGLKITNITYTEEVCDHDHDATAANLSAAQSEYHNSLVRVSL